MGFVIKNRNYYNSLGQIVSKEAFENEWVTFHQKLEEDYNIRIDEINQKEMEILSSLKKNEMVKLMRKTK